MRRLEYIEYYEPGSPMAEDESKGLVRFGREIDADRLQVNEYCPGWRSKWRLTWLLRYYCRLGSAYTMPMPDGWLWRRGRRG